MQNNTKDISNSELLEFIKETVATKEDLRSFATKEDLQLLATKEELKLLATKEDLRNLETRLTLRLDRIDGNFTKLRADKHIRKLLDHELTASKDSPIT